MKKKKWFIHYRVEKLGYDSCHNAAPLRMHIFEWDVNFKNPDSEVSFFGNLIKGTVHVKITLSSCRCKPVCFILIVFYFLLLFYVGFRRLIIKHTSYMGDFQNFYFCTPRNRYQHMSLERHKDESVFGANCSFK